MRVLLGIFLLFVVGCGRIGFGLIPDTDDPSSDNGTDSQTEPLSTDNGTDSQADTDSVGVTGTDSGTEGDTDTGACVSADWWNEEWSHRRRLTFDNAPQGEAFSGFTVLVRLDATRLDFSVARADGTDLRFIDQDGTGPLPYHIESWDPTGESAVAWVLVPDIQGTGEEFIWMYYGNDGATDVQDKAGTYGTGTEAVWHLDETGGVFENAVGTGMDCSWEGAGGDAGADGFLGGANQFDGVDNFLDCGVNLAPDALDYTITAWVNLDYSTTKDNYQILCSQDPDGAPYQGIGLYVRRRSGAGATQGGIGEWLDNNYHFSTENIVPESQWTFVAIRTHRATSGGSMEVSMNGGIWEPIQPNEDTSNLVIAPNTPLAIGRWTGTGGHFEDCFTKGLIDEVALHSVARGQGWIATQHRSMADSYITFSGPEQPCP